MEDLGLPSERVLSDSETEAVLQEIHHEFVKDGGAIQGGAESIQRRSGYKVLTFNSLNYLPMASFSCMYLYYKVSIILLFNTLTYVEGRPRFGPY